MPRRAAAVSKSVEARRDDMIRYKALTRLAESEARRDARTALQDQLRRTRVEALHVSCPPPLALPCLLPC